MHRNVILFTDNADRRADKANRAADSVEWVPERVNGAAERKISERTTRSAAGLCDGAAGKNGSDF